MVVTPGPLPLDPLGLELPLPLAGELVVAGSAVVVGRAPLGADPAPAQHPLERRVERALVDLEDVAGDLAEPERDPPAVHGLEGERLEDEHLERSLEEFGADGVGHGCSFRWSEGKDGFFLSTVKRRINDSCSIREHERSADFHPFGDWRRCKCEFTLSFGRFGRIAGADRCVQGA
jgi:hypothetical protein